MKTLDKNQRAIRSALFGTVLATASAIAQAQSLDDQYANFLAARCTRMNFARDVNFDLLPGQAGPNLQAFCSGLPPVGGGSDSSSATSGTSTNRGPADDPALRRRLAQLRDEDHVETSPSTTATTSDGAIGAFLSLNFQSEEQDPTEFEGGQEANTYALTAGLDRRFGTRAVIGIAARAEKLSGDFVSGGDFENQGYGATLYASWLPANELFFDFAAGIVSRSSESRRVVSFTRTSSTQGGPPFVLESIAPATAVSDTDQTEIGAELRSGYDWTAGAVSVGPRVALEYRRTTIDGYIESGSTPMTLIIDEQTEKSLRGALGLQASRAFTAGGAVLVLQGNLDWLREFEDDQRFISARFAEDLRPNPTRFNYQNQPPDRTAFAGRLSMSATWRNGLSGFVATDGLFGHEYLNRYGAALGLRKEF
jgi:hypothetical protein